MFPFSPRLASARDFRDLPAWLYLWLPLGCWLIVYLAGSTLDHATYEILVHGEISVVEISTVLVLIAAIVMGIRALRSAQKLDMRFLVGWLFLGTLGCIYFAGEETSWGQWYLRWSTPEAWQALNEQQETNLHNLAGIGFLLDQLPRLLLTLGAFVGGVAVPLYLRLRGEFLNPARIWYWLWPTLIALPAAVLGALLARIDERISDLVGHDWPYYHMQTGELKEFLLAYFLFVYLASLNLRLRQLREATRP